MTAVPLSLTHVNGNVSMIDNVQILRVHKIESMEDNTNPTSAVDITVVDVMFLLATTQILSNTYGEIAKPFMAKL